MSLLIKTSSNYGNKKTNEQTPISSLISRESSKKTMSRKLITTADDKKQLVNHFYKIRFTVVPKCSIPTLEPWPLQYKRKIRFPSQPDGRQSNIISRKGTAAPWNDTTNHSETFFHLNFLFKKRTFPNFFKKFFLFFSFTFNL